MAVKDSPRAAEARGYAKGYTAGQRRAQKAFDKLFWQQAFYAALNGFIQSDGWSQGEKRFTQLNDRVELARRAANEALRVATKEGKV